MSGSNITGSFDVVLKRIMPYNLHKIKRGMTLFKMWRGIKKAHCENKVNLIFIRFQTAGWIIKELHNILAALTKIFPFFFVWLVFFKVISVDD